MNRKVIHDKIIHDFVRLTLSVRLNGPLLYTSGVRRDLNYISVIMTEPCCEKTGLRGFRPGPTPVCTATEDD